MSNIFHDKYFCEQKQHFFTLLFNTKQYIQIYTLNFSQPDYQILLNDLKNSYELLYQN